MPRLARNICYQLCGRDVSLRTAQLVALEAGNMKPWAIILLAMAVLAVGSVHGAKVKK